MSINSLAPTTLDGLSDAVATSSALALGANTPAAPAASTVAVGNNAMRYATGGTGNVAVGSDSLAYATGGQNVAVGVNAISPDRPPRRRRSDVTPG